MLQLYCYNNRFLLFRLLGNICYIYWKKSNFHLKYLKKLCIRIELNLYNKNKLLELNLYNKLLMQNFKICNKRAILITQTCVYC